MRDSSDSIRTSIGKKNYFLFNSVFQSWRFDNQADQKNHTHGVRVGMPIPLRLSFLRDLANRGMAI